MHEAGKSQKRSVQWSVSSLTAAVPTQCLFRTEAFVSAQLKQSRLSQRTALKIGARLFFCGREWQVCSLCSAVSQQVWLLNTLCSDLCNLFLDIQLCLGLCDEILRYIDTDSSLNSCVSQSHHNQTVSTLAAPSVDHQNHTLTAGQPNNNNPLRQSIPLSSTSAQR